METRRRIRKTFLSNPVVEGAGVRLKRAFGNREVPLFDPFLLLDDFRSSDPADYLKGFPWHPHRGIETITYVLTGDVEHGDSMGNKGVIGSGDVQWMTAGSGIIHQEMPKGDDIGRMEGFQLWANLPADRKMMEPRYRDVKAETIPTVRTAEGAGIKIICGSVGDVTGPVRDIVTDPEYLDVTVPAGAMFTHPTKRGHTVFAYVIAGDAYFGQTDEPGNEKNLEKKLGNGTVVLYGDGDHMGVRAGEAGVRFLLISGRPIGEPVAWYGPIVMNTEEELRVAFEEYDRGTFIRHPV